MNSDTYTIHFKTISELHQVVGISKPKHPQFSIYRFEDLPKLENVKRTKLISDFYQITLKTECPCKMQYGQTQFDFDEGIISCFAPKQVSIIDKDFVFATAGWLINIHPDFLRTYSISQKIKTYGFFDYKINEALILSEDEQKSIETIFEQIESEYRSPIDDFSQDVMISAIDLLLTHFNRYYKRQFITRKTQHSGLLNEVEKILNSYFLSANEQKLPSPAYLASQLNVSPKYLSDCLKRLTGQTTQQIIHEKLIEKAKDILTTTELSVGEIAYLLGFEYPQSFSKLFRNKMNVSPLEFRKSFN
ncbi:helix-turn-helix domain-containing protein [Sphingobacterium haloxyli]|uniref:AraC family transcriptional regulator n=1 Tax=Sphingobacterium haloxyli TaxID=2100533 RepID=A0A2S9J7G8_9SPHI|nr:AraC family transcriptional regulator [Sphingobacterium haloxyli]PRD48711.1 AraC family transcriptional regulator [Sphingobacterium haloxyli]